MPIINKYDLFAKAFELEYKNDSEGLAKVIDQIIANGWRENYDSWSQHVAD